VGFASGIAADGFLPIIFNHASFTIRRSYEQILLDCCLQDRKVILLGMGAGGATAHLGSSHTTFDDIALTRVMPNMETFIPYGSDDIQFNFDYILNSKNSVYVRLSKYGKYNLEGYNLHHNSKLVFKKFGDSFSNKCIISTGPISYNVFQAVKDLDVLHIHIPFLKDIGNVEIFELLKDIEIIYVFEEHSIIGGLFSLISELIVSSIYSTKFKVIFTGINDVFMHKYGTQEDYWKYFKIDSSSIRNLVLKSI
jgi:transketolase